MGKSNINKLQELKDLIKSEARDATPEENQKIVELSEKIEAAAKKSEAEIEVIFIRSPSAIFFLPHRVGQTGKFTEAQVKEFEAAEVAKRTK